MARYDQPHLKQFAAATRNQYGKGIGWYVGTIAGETTFYDKLVASLLKDAGIEPLIAPPSGVEVGTRASAKRELLFLINHTDTEKSLNVPKGNRELLADKLTGESLKLEPFGVAVIELLPKNSQREKQ